jgi:serine/threonine-protein kinase
MTQPKPMALLAYLALARPRGYQRRDTIAALFWPELDQQRARAALRKALYSLRDAIGAEALVGRGDQEVAIIPEHLWCDATAFETALDDGRYGDALQLYQGDLLAGFHAPDVAAEFEEWLGRERDRLRARAADGAWKVSEAAEGSGDGTEAVRWGKRACSLAADDETSVRRLIQLHDRLGDRAGALKTFEGLVAYLEEEYDSEPAPETLALVDAIRSRSEERFAVDVAGAHPSSRPAERPPTETRRRSAALTIALGAVFLTAALYAVFGWVLSPSVDVGAVHRVAVLYFENLSNDPGDDYLAHGLTEETITRLGRLSRFSVMSRPAVRRFQGTEAEPAEIGRTLGVDYLVSGSVRRADDRFRVTVELIRADDGFHLWGDTYESGEGNLLEIEERIARTLALEIAGTLEPEDERLLASLPTRNATAYRHYLKGQYLMAERNPTSVARAIAEFQTASQADPGFVQALASAGYGYTLFIDWEWNYEGVSRDSLFALGFDAAARALERDSLTAEAWRILAMLHMHRNPRDFTDAARAFERALAIDPHDASVLHSYAAMQARLGNLRAAAELEHRALESEPGRPISLFILFEVAYRSGEHQEALQWLDSALVVEPGFFFAYAFRGLTHLRLGQIDAAREDGQTSARFSAGVDVPGLTVLALVDLARGDTTSARRRLGRIDRDVTARDGGASQDALWPAMIETALGAREEALIRLERVPNKSAEFAFWLLLPEFDALRDDPRFQRLIADTRPRIEERGAIA